MLDGVIVTVASSGGVLMRNAMLSVVWWYAVSYASVVMVYCPDAQFVMLRLSLKLYGDDGLDMFWYSVVPLDTVMVTLSRSSSCTCMLMFIVVASVEIIDVFSCDGLFMVIVGALVLIVTVYGELCAVDPSVSLQ